MRSIQARLLAGTVIGSTLVLSISGIVLYVLVRASLWAEFDSALAGKARTLAAMVEQDGDKIEFEIDNLKLPEFERTDRPEYVQLWQDNGRVLAPSGSFRGPNLERPAGPLDEPVFRSTVLPDGRRGRLVAITFRPRPGNEDEAPRHDAPSSGTQATLVIARETADIDRTLARLRALIVGVGAAAVLASAAVLAWVVRGGLRPLRHLAGRIDQVSETDLATRIEIPDAPSELLPVIDRLNGLLQRLDSAFIREKTFTSDVAHELRTPLAGLQSTLEVSLSRQRTADEHRAHMREGLSITRQMQSMVHNLLVLARVEAGQMAVDLQPVEVNALLRDAWKPFALRTEQRGVEILWGPDAPCMATTDRELIGQVLHNLLDNAATYVNEKGEIRMETECGNGMVRVMLSNTGSLLSAQDAQHVFERFWRADSSRTGCGIHCGLGLSLSERIIRLLGGAISAESTPQGVFRVVLTLAAAHGPEAPGH